MISFKDFLTEARMAPLYHGTRKDKAIQIVDSDKLIRGVGKEPGLNKQTISLTRNLTFAIQWIDEMTAYGGIVFELDQQKLTHRYKVVPYNFFGQATFGSHTKTRLIPFESKRSKGPDWAFENQFEEAVLSDIDKISKYITKIYVVGPAVKEGKYISDKLQVPMQRVK